MNSLPVEILGEIAGMSIEAYRGIALTMRLFAHGLTPEVLINWQIHFGHSCTITAEVTTWWCNGKLHRTDGPAEIYPDGGNYTFRYSKLAHDNLVRPDGTERWYYNGLLHRVGGPAHTHADGTYAWYRDGKLHRDDGPAMISSDGTQYWVHNGNNHRDGGPAVIFLNGRELWYRDGVVVPAPANDN